jgi:hypothetical protein
MDFPYFGISGGVQSMASVWVMDCQVVDRGGSTGGGIYLGGGERGGGTPNNPLPPTGEPENDESNNFCRDNHCIPFPEEEILKDPSFVGTKADCVYERLLDLSGGFRNAIQKFDGEFPVAHLKVKMADLGLTRRGQASPPQNYIIDITLNNNSSTGGVNFRPNLMTAKTLIHEVIHAEIFRKMLSLSNSNGNIDVSKLNDMLLKGDYPGMLDYYTRFGLNGFQHQQMAQHYRATIGRVLQEFDTGITLSDDQIPQQKYMDLAWEGLNHSNIIAWNNSISEQERTRINNVIKDYIDMHKNQNCR